MPALLGETLILDVHAGDAELLVFAHGTDHVQLVAVSGIGIGDHRDIDGRRDAASVGGHLAHGDQTVVGVAQRRRCPRAGHVDGGKAGALDGTGADAVVGARRRQHGGLGQQGAQLVGYSHRRILLAVG